MSGIIRILLWGSYKTVLSLTILCTDKIYILYYQFILFHNLAKFWPLLFPVFMVPLHSMPNYFILLQSCLSNPSTVRANCSTRLLVQVVLCATLCRFSLFASDYFCWHSFYRKKRERRFKPKEEDATGARSLTWPAYLNAINSFRKFILWHENGVKASISVRDRTHLLVDQFLLLIVCLFLATKANLSSSFINLNSLNLRILSQNTLTEHLPGWKSALCNPRHCCLARPTVL